MLIMNQEETKFFNLDTMSHIFLDENGYAVRDICYIYIDVDNHKYRLGTYRNKERAKEVLKDMTDFATFCGKYVKKDIDFRQAIAEILVTRQYKMPKE